MAKNIVDPGGDRQNSFAERLRVIVEEAGGKAAFARSVRGRGGRVSPSMIGQYVAGRSEPSLSRLVAMAKAGGVNLAWLATGEGPMRPGEVATAPPAAVDEQLLADCIAALEMALDRVGRQLSPEKKAEVIVLLYEDFMMRGGVDAALVARIVRLAV